MKKTAGRRLPLDDLEINASYKFIHKKITGATPIEQP